MYSTELDVPDFSHCYSEPEPSLGEFEQSQMYLMLPLSFFLGGLLATLLFLYDWDWSVKESISSRK